MGKTLTILFPYLSLDFIVPQKSKSITLIVLVLVQIDIQVVYREIRKSSVHNVNEDRMHAISASKILLRVADSVNDTFWYLLVYPMVPRPTNLNDYRTIEHVLDWFLFIQLQKLNCYKQANDIIFAYVVKAIKMERRLREWLNKVGDILHLWLHNMLGYMCTVCWRCLRIHLTMITPGMVIVGGGNNLM